MTTSAIISEDSDGEFSPTVQNLLDQTSLKWIFVGGKGGVGKTTTSCSLGILLSACRESVLIISTDPAHNLSDAFAQKFSHEPQLVNTFKNLYCMEVESSKMASDMTNLAAFNADGASGDGGMGSMGGLMKELGTALPGIDETMSFLQIMKSVQNMEFSCIVFDTAPTGHTLRLLRFPTTLTSAFEKLSALRGSFGGMFSAMSSMFGGAQNMDFNGLMAKFDEMKLTIAEVNKFFRDPEVTTFVCVCIPEFLSVYETERLVQELTKFEIDTHNLIVNQVLFAEPDACRKFLARKRMQDKYIDNIYELYGYDFNITVLPITDEEVRGSEKLRAFAKYYLKPYEVENNVSDAKETAALAAVKLVCEKHGLDLVETLKEISDAGLKVT